MREELIRLRQQTEAQRHELDRLIDRDQNVDEPQGDVGVRLVNALIEGLQLVQIESKPPKFENESRNPCEFIQSLEKYFSIKRVRNDTKLNVVESALEGRARAWFETQRDNFHGYDEFKDGFLREFYSVPIKVKIKTDWLSKRMDSNQGNLQSFFLDQLKTAQYFIPKMESYAVHFCIIQQMPFRTREALVAVDFSDMSKVLQALAQLDATYAERKSNQKESFDSLSRSWNNNLGHGTGSRERQGPRISRIRQSVCVCNSNRGQERANVSGVNINDHDQNYPTNYQSHVNQPVKLPNLSLPPPSFALDDRSDIHISRGNNLN